MDAFESGLLDLPDFFFTGDDYRYRFDPEAKQRFLELLRERFNSGVRYRGRTSKWDTVIEQKTVELGRCLVGRTVGLDFSEPSPNLHGMGDKELRRRILSLTQQEAWNRKEHAPLSAQEGEESRFCQTLLKGPKEADVARSGKQLLWQSRERPGRVVR
jgi:hypothetical protein